MEEVYEYVRIDNQYYHIDRDNVSLDAAKSKSSQIGRFKSHMKSDKPQVYKLYKHEKPLLVQFMAESRFH